jgi:hypothetical protein
MASAWSEIWVGFPGKRTIGKQQFCLIFIISSSRILVSTRLPPMKIWVAGDWFIFSSNGFTLFKSILSGSRRMASNFSLSTFDFRIWL